MRKLKKKKKDFFLFVLFCPDVLWAGQFSVVQCRESTQFRPFDVVGGTAVGHRVLQMLTTVVVGG